MSNRETILFCQKRGEGLALPVKVEEIP